MPGPMFALGVVQNLQRIDFLMIELLHRRKLEANLPGVRFSKSHDGKNEKNVVSMEKIVYFVWRISTEVVLVFWSWNTHHKHKQLLLGAIRKESFERCKSLMTCSSNEPW